MTQRNTSVTAVAELGRSLDWAMYWIRRCAEVPLAEEERDEWERWEEAQRALRTWGPESGYAREAYTLAYRERRKRESEAHGV